MSVAPLSAQTAVAGLTQAQLAALAAAQGTTQGQAQPVSVPVVDSLGINKAGVDEKAVQKPSDTYIPLTSPSLIERMFAVSGSGEGPALSQYGYSIFSGAGSPSIASIGDDYILGPQDKLVLYLWGDPVDIKELLPSYDLVVDRAGNIFFAPVGQLAVWGQDLGTFRNYLKSQLDRKYKKLGMSVALGTLREFPVSVAGFATSPGTIMATGADTVVSVLARAGGVMKTGSLRSILLTRVNKTGSITVNVDFYDLLIQGKNLDLRVREGDSILVPGIGAVAGIAGEVRRPGIYELKAEKSVADILALSGGSLPSARSSSISLVRFDGDQKKLVAGDLASSTFVSAKIADGDLLVVGVSSPLVGNSIEVTGSVKFPGRYTSDSIKKLGELIAKVQLLPETSQFYGRVYRIESSGRDASFTFSPRDIVDGKSDFDLRSRDSVVFYRYDYLPATMEADRFPQTVVVSGTARYAGLYAWKQGMRLSSIIMRDQMLAGTNLNYAELERVGIGGKTEYRTFSPADVIASKADIELMPRDTIRLVPANYLPAKPDFDKYPATIALYGPVKYQGLYAWKGGMKLGALLKSAEVLLDANQYYAEIVRPLGGGKNEYLTFAPREVLSGAYDMELRSSDTVRLISFAARPQAMVKPATEVVPLTTEAGTGLAATAAAPVGALLGASSGTVAMVGAALPTVNATVAGVVSAPAAGSTAAANPATPAGPTLADAGADGESAVQFLEVVTVAGPVRYQGVYARTPGLKLSDIVTADQILQTTNTGYAELTRYRGDGKYEYVAFSPKEVLEGRYDLPLAALDSIRYQLVGYTPTKPVFDRFVDVILFEGDIRYPGIYAKPEGMTLSKILTKDWLLTTTNTGYAELVRYVKEGIYEYRTFSPADIVVGKIDIEMKPRDTLRFVSADYLPAKPDFDRYPETVALYGPVKFKGLYAWKSGMKLGALLKSAQVLLDANQYYAEIVRPLGGGKNEYLTFAPREVLSGSYDMELRSSDTVRLISFTARPQAMVKPATEVVPLTTEAGTGLAATSGAIGSAPSGVPGSAPAGAPSGAASGTAAMVGIALPTANATLAGIVSAPAAGSTAVANPATPAGPTLADAGADGESDVQFLEVVTVAGPVRYQGVYARTPGLKLSDIVTTDQILQTTNTGYAELTRYRGDGKYEYVAFSPKEVLEGRYDLPLAALDSIRYQLVGYTPTKPVFDRFVDVILFEGDIRYPGIYAKPEGMKLSNILTKDWLLTTTNTGYAELVRYVKEGIYEYRTFSPADIVAGKIDIEMKPRDTLRFVSADYLPAKPDFDRYPETVALYGPVKFKGLYAWKGGMKLGALLKSAQVLLDANQYYAEIVRPLGGGKNEYLTFAPREVLSGAYDMELRASDSVRLLSYASKPESMTRAGVEIQPLVSGNGTGMGGTAATATATGAATAAPAAAQAAIVGQTETAGPDTAASQFLEAVTVTGPVRYQGVYARTPGLKLSDVVTADQIMQTTNTVYAELTRYLGDGKYEYYAFSPKDVLEKRFNMALAAQDTIRYVQVGYLPPKPDFNTYHNFILVTGPARHPGVYAFATGMKLSTFVKMDELLVETNKRYAELTRKNPDGSETYYSFDPTDVATGKKDIALTERDQLRYVAFDYLPAKPDFDRYPETVALYGPVKFKGLYAWKGGMKLGALLKSAEVLLEANQYYAEIVRPLGGGKNEYKTFAPREVLSGAYDMELRASDSVRLISFAARPQALVKPATEVVPQATETGVSAPGGAMGGAASGTVPSAGAAATTTPITATGTGVGVAPPVVSSFGAIPSTSIGPPQAEAGADGESAIQFLEVVAVSGPAQYQGVYARTPGLKLSDVVTADQILQTTNMDYAELTRYSGDGKHEYVAFSPKEVVQGRFDLPLAALDSIRYQVMGYVPANPDFDHFPKSVLLSGAVNFPGLYALRQDMKLSSIISIENLKLDTNMYYARLVKKLPGGRHAYMTFAPREVVAGIFDIPLSGSESIQILSMNENRQPLGSDQTIGVFKKETQVPTGQVQTATGQAQVPTGQAQLPAGQTLALTGQAATQNPIDETLLTGSTMQLFQSSPLPIVNPQPAGSVSTEIIKVEVDPEAKIFNEVVTVSGPVKYFGYYARSPGLKLSSIVSLDQMLPSTNRFYAELTRYRGDGFFEYLTFSPKDVIDGKFDLEMRALDDIRFQNATYLPKNPDFRLFSEVVALYGPGKNPGLYAWKKGMKLSSIFGPESLASNTNLFYAEIERRKSDGSYTFLTFIPRDVTSGKQDIELFAQDVVRFIPADTNYTYANKDRYPETVTVEGRIDRSGLFAWRKGLYLPQIIDTAIFRMDTNLDYAEIRRSTSTGDSIITFAPKDLVAGLSSATIALEPRDSILFFPKYYKSPIAISGEVKTPKVIPYYEGMTMFNTLRAIELSQDPKELKAVINRSGGKEVVIYLDDLLFSQSGSSVILLPGDSITLQKLLPDERTPQVLVRGAVKNPQAISWKQGMRLSDALKVVGGYGEGAYPKGLVLTRKSAAVAQQVQIERLMASLDSVSQEAKAAATTGSTLGALEGGVTLVNLQLDLMTQKNQLAELKQLGKEGFGRLNLDLPPTLQALKGSSEDVLIERDDAIFVPIMPSYILVIGQVTQQSVLAFRKGMKVSDAIADSGWGTNSADIKAVSVLHANGKVTNYSGKGFLFFRPNIMELGLEPGDAVLVPRETIKINSTWAYIKDSVSIIYQLVTATVSTLKILGL